MFKKIKIYPDKVYAAALKLEDDQDPSAGFESIAYLKRQLKSPLEIEQEKKRKQAFSVFLKQLRITNHLSVEEFSKRSRINEDYVNKLEDDLEYRASPRTLMLLSEFYKIPKNVVMQLSGAISNIDNKISENMVRFAAMSEGFENLTAEEKKSFHEFITVLRNYKEKNGAGNTSRHREAR